MRIRFVALLMVISVFGAEQLWGQKEARLLRFPAIHGNTVVFTYAGDLYAVAAAGGIARKITNDVGFEMFARFSPDGSTIAFTGQYDGNTEVYTMPADGGVPRRLTYTATLDRDDVSDRMGPNNIVMAWKSNSEIVYRSRRIEANDFIGQLYVASVQGGAPVQLPLPRGGFCSFSPDGKKMVYNRVFREFRTWKRYRGGQADDIWLYDFETKKTINLTNNPAQDIIPMWIGDKIYFSSDRDGRDHVKRLNLYSYDLASRETKQLTFFKDFDVKFPSADQTSVVFENGGFLYRLDAVAETVTKIPVSIAEDFAVGRGGSIDVSKNISAFEISPDGNRALFGARGELFTVPAKYGNTRNLTNTSGVHERNAVWSPDGKWIAYISDATGDNEVYVMPQDGSAPGKQLTRNSDTYKFQILWSPDSKKLLWADKMQRLQYVDVESQKVTLVAQATAFEFSDYSWSPDSKWIAFARPEEKVMTTIQLYSVEKKEIYPVTDGWYSSGEPVFSADGKYLFFVSDRTFNPTYSQTEWNHAYGDMEKIYFVTLSADTKSPFAPKSDEVAIKEEKKEPEKKKEAEAKPQVKVSIESLQQRIGVLPVTASSYRHITAVGDKVFYVRRGSRDEKPRLLFYDLEKQKETELGDIGAYEISADGKKMIVSSDGGYAILDLPTARIEVKDKLVLSDLKMNLNRAEEWHQIYYEAWRQMRDFFYDPFMHHVNWEGVKKNYEVLLPFVNHRADLTYIIGEMIGELSVGHSYVGGGDMPKPERIPQGLLGAQLERDAASSYYRIVRILKGQNWDPALRSPLTDIGVEAKEGEYILAVNGKSTKEMQDIYQALVGLLTSGSCITIIGCSGISTS
ncbi:MAG: PDZ domain-containing protein [Ignavibacteriales bacterium]|nr:PDZ domain-containing protein [Ignavibacteriales bacterium]